jgi:phosphate transport system permease protein
MKLVDRFAEFFFGISAVLSLAGTILIFGFMVILGLPLFKGGQFFELLSKPWLPDHGIFGIYPMIVGTLAISLLGLAFAFPLGLGCSAFISVFGPKKLGRILKRTVQLMTGIPTVIYGFVGIFLLVPVIREVFESGSGMCILSASLLLAVLVSPTMILFFSDSFDQVPQPFLDAVDALGGNKAQKILYVILPYSWRGVLTGLILGMGRAMGDTMIALMVAGNAVAVPGSVLDSARTLTAHIALIIAADFESLEFKALFACGIILYLFTTLIAVSIRSIDSKSWGRK